MVEPREGHLRQAINIVLYLKQHNRSWIVLNPQKFDIEWEAMENEAPPAERALYLKKIYPDASEEDPPRMPETRGNSVQLSAFVDADHAGNVVTRRSHTGILVFANLAPIHWISKK